MALSEEQKDKMAAGRRAAAERRKAAQALSGPALAETHTGAVEEAFATDYAFQAFLLTLDEETKRMVGDETLREVFAQQQKSAATERRTILRKAAEEKAKLAARVAAGLVGPAEIQKERERVRMLEPVEVLVDLPDGSDIGVRTNGKIFRHGETVQVTRGEAIDIRYRCWAAMQGYMDFLGQNKMSRLRQQAGFLDQSI